MAIRSLVRKGQNSLIKILSLSFGITMGLVLLAKVFFEFSYDNFYPDTDRIYSVWTIDRMDAEDGGYSSVSGGVAVGMRNEIPEVESATRYTYLGMGMVFYTPDLRKYKADFIFADSCYFDVLPRKILAGNPKEILARPMYIMISEKIAKTMGGGENLVGQSIFLDIAPGETLVIGGIFETLPENAHLQYDILVSMPSLGRYFSYDGTENWLGNDRYKAYVKLYPEVNSESLGDAILEMQGRYQDLEAIKRAGYDLTYTLVPLRDLHSQLPATKRMALLLSLLAFALIFTAIMNYTLIVLSSLVSKTKDVAVHKSYGADVKDISAMIFTETFIHFILSLMLSLLLVLLFQSTIRQIIGASIGALFNPQSLLYLFVIALAIFVLSGALPSWLYAKIPVAAAFRSYKETKRNWKLVSLFFQIVATTFLVVFITVIGKQYYLMINDKPGYSYENLLYCDLENIRDSERKTLMNELHRLPVVNEVAACTTLPIWGGRGGNSITLPGEEREVLHITDMYQVDNNYFPLMEIPIIEGQNFRQPTATNQVIVNRKFVEQIIQNTGWTDGVIGKTVEISAHGLSTIVGVHADTRLGTIASPMDRPSAYSYTAGIPPIILIKMNRLDAEDILQVKATMENMFPTKDINLQTYRMGMINMYEDARLFRDTVMVGGIITLLITLIGLIGYVKEETLRRRSEIAIRKINGGTIKDILQLFLINILKVTLPALIIGGMIAFVVTSKWQEGFSDKASLSFSLLMLCGVVILVIVLGIVTLNCYRAASDNPVDPLKNN